MRKQSKRILPFAIAVFLALLPTYLVRFSIGTLPTTLLEVLFGALLIIWLIAGPDWKPLLNLRKHHRVFFTGTLLLLTAATISVFVAHDMRTAAGLWKAYFIEPVLFFIILITSLKKTDLHKIITALSISAFGVALIGILQFYFFSNGLAVFGTTLWQIPNEFWRDELTRRATSVFGFPNAIGLYLSPLIPLFIFDIYKHWQRRFKNLAHDLTAIAWLSITIVLAIWAIILASSLGALIALGGTLIVFGLLWKKTRLITAALIIIIGVIIPFTQLKEPIKQEVLLQNYSGKIRLQMWKETLEQLETRPVLGNGLGSYQVSITPYHKFDWAEIYLYPHNAVLNFWTETGLLGVLAIAMIVVRALVAAIQRRHGITIAGAASITVMMIHGLVDVPYLKNDLAMLTWFIIAIFVIVASKQTPPVQSRR